MVCDKIVKRVRQLTVQFSRWVQDPFGDLRADTQHVYCKEWPSVINLLEFDNIFSMKLVAVLNVFFFFFFSFLGFCHFCIGYLILSSKH